MSVLLDQLIGLEQQITASLLPSIWYTVSSLLDSL